MINLYYSLALALVACLSSSCTLVLRYRDIPNADGVAVQGSCMCATCWDQAFCMASGIEWSIPVPLGGCPTTYVEDGVSVQETSSADEVCWSPILVFIRHFSSRA